MKSSKEGIKAASATYRKATNAIADTIGITPNHSDYPKEDFEEVLKEITKKSNDITEKEDNCNEIALKFYRIGLRRGLIKATDLVVDGILKYKSGKLECEDDIQVKVRIKMPNKEMQNKEFVFKPSDIGFE